MGIAFAIVYLPLIVLLTLFAVIVGWKRTIKSQSGSVSQKKKFLSIIFGICISCVMVLLVASSIQSKGNTDFHAFFKQVFVSLLLPVAVGFLISTISFSSYKNDGGRHSLRLINYFGVGVMQAVWIFPVVILGFSALYSSFPMLNKDHRSKMNLAKNLCREDRIDIRKTVRGVKSIYTPDLGIGLHRSLPEQIDFTEWRQAIYKDKHIYKRYSKDTKNDRHRNGEYKTIQSAISEPSADIEVSVKYVFRKQYKSAAIVVQETTIMDRRNGEILAVFSIVRPLQEYEKFGCPDLNTLKPFKKNLIYYVLGLLDEKTTSEMANYLEEYENYHHK